MNLQYKIVVPNEFSEDEIVDFKRLLTKQGQINKVEGKAERCFRICLVNLNGKAVGIGALKQVYKSPFKYAGVPELGYGYDFEIGYLFVDKDLIDNSFGSLGIGKYITRLLLNEVRNKNVFATTENSNDNLMYHILQSYNFKPIGNSYKGQETKKDICLMVLNRT